MRNVAHSDILKRKIVQELNKIDKIDEETAKRVYEENSKSLRV